MFSVRFHFLLWTAVTVCAKEPLYGKIGDKAVLTLDPVVNPIKGIEWKHGPDIAMDWYGDETTSFRQFQGRGMLNTSTGELTITGLTRDDSGTYTAEINGKVASKIELLVISPVPKPTISVRCEPEMTHCNLTCSGSTTGAEPVTYKWTSGDIMLSSTKEHKITKENKENKEFSCMFENPVSSEISEKVSNPFIITFFVVYRTRICILIPVILFVGIIIYLMYNSRKAGAVTFSGLQNIPAQEPTSVVVQDTNNGTVISTISEVHETLNQDQKTVESPDIGNETERSATSPEVAETSTEDQKTAEPPEPSNETEKSAMIPDDPETCRLLMDEQTADPEDEAQS